MGGPTDRPLGPTQDYSVPLSGFLVLGMWSGLFCHMLFGPLVPRRRGERCYVVASFLVMELCYRYLFTQYSPSRRLSLFRTGSRKDGGRRKERRRMRGIKYGDRDWL
ncbi:hypothetical protein QBC47DRAFT_391233, partial [Echria macrotheca]